MTASTIWNTAPAVLNLGGAEVHVWMSRLDVCEPKLNELEQTLSADEQLRAARFHFVEDRNHYVTGRGLLRSLLGQYLAADPRELKFSYNPFGKPELAAASGQAELRFNLAHSHGLALFAFTREREVGVDLEWIRPDFATNEIAERFFSRAEVAVLRALPPEMQAQAFFNCWTRKEAFIKAHGMGLSMPLDQFVVTLAPGESPALLSAEGDPQAANRWAMHALDTAAGYVAALAVAGKECGLKCWHCPE